MVSSKRQEAQQAKYQQELIVSRESERECSASVNRQNSAIERVRVDTVWMERKIDKLITKYSVVRDTIILKLGKDSSCENQIHIIDGLLLNFSDGMYPKNSDKN
jgi:predicted RNase H-like nuclease (RuvC/YqgF family)